MASEHEFLTAYGWAFMAMQEARDRADAAPESVRLDLKVMAGQMEQDLRDDLIRVVNRAANTARRIAAIAERANESTSGGTDAR